MIANILEALATLAVTRSYRICLLAHSPPAFHSLLLLLVIPSRPPCARLYGGAGLQTLVLCDTALGERAIRFLGCSPSFVFVRYFDYVLVLFDIIMSQNESGKKVAEDTVTVEAMTWPTGGYDLFISLMFILVLDVLAIYVDVSAIYAAHSYMIKYQYEFNTVNGMFIIYS